MKSTHAWFCLSFTIALQSFAQLDSKGVRISNTPIGTSAISVNTIVARTLNFNFPVYDYKADTLVNYLFITNRQKDEGSGNYLSRSVCAAIDSKRDTVKWMNETGFYDIILSNKHLLMSGDVRSVKYNKVHGFDEIRYDSRIFYTIPKYNVGFMYNRDESDVLNCVNLTTGVVTWTCMVPRFADWSDVKQLGDSVLLVAANGIHSLHIKRGLQWSVPMATAQRTNRSFTYSLAKYNTIQKISSVCKTSLDQTVVTQLASNIVVRNNVIYFASKERFVALSLSGKQLWQMDLRNYPVSKMFVSATDTSLLLVNFGLATHSNNFVTWGRPFLLTFDASNGHIINQYDLSHIENLADFIMTDKSLVFAGKDDILEAVPGKRDLNSVLALNKNNIGQFVEFVNGNEYYTFKEGYFVPLSFLNDIIYFRADNNKVYGIDGKELVYEYHFTELYKLDKKYQDKTILTSNKQTLITSRNFELLFTLDTGVKNAIVGSKMYFIDKTQIHVVDLDALK